MDPLVYYEKYWNQDDPPPEADPTTPKRERLLLEALSLLHVSGRATRVLDAGCGSGWFVKRLSEGGFDVSGLDASATATSQARARCPGRDISTGSLEDRLPYNDMEFDAVWCTEVIEHLFDIGRFLGEARRVTRDGGLLILTTPYHGLLKNLAIALAGFDAHFDPAKSHIRFLSIASLDRLLTQAGFQRLYWRGLGRTWPLYMSMFVVARRAR